MINVQLFHHSSNLNPFMAKFFGGTDKITIITPNPVYADIARSKFADTHHSIETVTIAKFLKDELTQLVSEDELSNYQGKSDLNLLLGSLWKIKREGSAYELFKRSFQVLTDFRSFTLNEDILKTILENYDEELAGGVLWFHKILEQMDVIDEHRSYFLLAERLRQGDLPPTYESNRTIVFWGFDFLTGSQIDLLNALGIRNEIVIPFPFEAYDKSKDLDWIKWITKFEAKVEIIDTADSEKVDLSTYVFPKNYLGKTLKSIKESKYKKDKVEIVLGCKNISDDFVAELPFSNYSYKVSVDLFEEKLLLLREIITKELRHVVFLKSSKLIELCQNYAKECIEEQDFRGIKAASVLIETINKWVDLSEQNEKIFEFDIKVLFDSAKLDVPRNSLFSSSNESSLTLKTLKTIEQTNNELDSLLCVTSDYGPVKGSVIQYSENVEQYLASIGPVRRGELEFLILKSKVQESLRQSGKKLLIEEGLLEHDLGWSNIVSDFNLVNIKNDIQSIENKKYYFPKVNSNYSLNTISASKLQTYIDCPRKFYLSYGLKQKPRIELLHELNYMQLGLIEHAVIENYLKKNSSFNEEILNDLIYEILSEIEEKGDLLPERKEEYWLEVKALCTQIINELLELNNALGLNLEFEKDISAKRAIETRGSIDCFGHNADTVMILDFKRGGGSIPSQVGLKEFQKIQMWFYLNQLELANIYDSSKKLIWGYINLSKLEESLIYCSDDVILDRIKGLDLKLVKKTYKFDEEMSLLFEDYKKYEAEQLDLISSDRDFSCSPKEVKVCQYCELSNICPRSKEDSHV